MNLVLNAGEATPEGGEVELRGRLEEEPDVPRVILEVRDRGTGIAPKHLESIFEPYFTTKGDMGNGLGLRNVWNIVTDLSGEIRVDSELGKGSTFYVHLPVERRQVPRT